MYHKDGDLTHIAMFNVHIRFFFFKVRWCLYQPNHDICFVLCYILCFAYFVEKKYIHIISGFKPIGLRNVSNCSNTEQSVIFEEWKTNLMSLAILFHFLCVQHISDINISIIRSLRLRWWITTSVVLFSVRCVLELLVRLVLGGVRFAGFSHFCVKLYVCM